VSEVVPNPFELEIATKAARKAARQLGLPFFFQVRFYGPTMDRLSGKTILGSTDPLSPRTVWVRAGLPWRETRASVTHEVGHVGQAAAGQPVGHDGLGRGWQACRVERFAQGDKAARKSLRRDIAAYLDQLKRDNETHLSTSEGA